MVEETIFSHQITHTNNKDTTDVEETKSPVEASLGVSEKWDAQEAGREVAETAIRDLTRPPDFFLLFSTIHYEKYGGFQEFLNGVWDVLPKGTPLVGGTVVGFMNNYGCYTHGTTALAVSCPEMDVTIGYGRNTKRSPKKAARQCAEMVRMSFKKSKYKNKFLLNLVSGPEVPSIPGVGRKKIIKSGLISNFAMQAFGLSQTLFQKGVGREDEIFEELVKELPDFHMVLGTSVDDYKGISNYLFFNHEILTNHVVSLGLSTDLNLDVYTTHGMKETDIKFEITKLSRNKHIIHKINNKPAVPELYKLLDWPEEFLNEKTMMHRILYYPISLKRHGREMPAVMTIILKNSIVTPCMVDKDEVSILTVNGKNLVHAIEENLEYFAGIDPLFCLCSACLTIPQTLGYKINMINQNMANYFKDKPYLIFWCAGEGTYSPTKDIIYANMSYNTAIFGLNKGKIGV